MVSSFVDRSYHSPDIASIKTLSFLIKRVFLLNFIMVYIENTGLRDCSGFLQIRSHMV